MNFRFFAKTFYILLTIFIALNALIWFSWVKDLTDPKLKKGDLLRLGYLQGFTTPAMQSPPLPAHHIEAKDYNGQKIDMISIGDSFSMGNSLQVGCYQDHLASHFNISILNIPTQKDLSFHPVTILIQLINSGYLDRIKPKYLLLQSIEREAASRLSSDFNLTKTSTISELESKFSKRGNAMQQGDQRDDQSFDFNLKFINNGNWKFVTNNVQYLFRDNAFKSKVIKSKLKQHFFSSPQGDVLLFHRDDYTAARTTNPQTMTTVNDNLNILADLLKTKGISLIFMPAPDKLTLYEPYLKKRTYPKSIFFEELRKLPRRYTFVDTKEILAKELSAGVKDLYYQDDTHWSWKAPAAISKSFILP